MAAIHTRALTVDQNAVPFALITAAAARRVTSTYAARWRRSALARVGHHHLIGRIAHRLRAARTPTNRPHHRSPRPEHSQRRCSAHNRYLRVDTRTRHADLPTHHARRRRHHHRGHRDRYAAVAAAAAAVAAAAAAVAVAVAACARERSTARPGAPEAGLGPTGAANHVAWFSAAAARPAPR